jgi:hypothetical protein
MPMLREEIRQIVHASVTEALGHLGFTIDDPHAIQKDMIHLRRHRVGQEEIEKWIKRTAIGVFVTGILYFMWDAFFHIITFKR